MTKKIKIKDKQTGFKQEIEISSKITKKSDIAKEIASKLSCQLYYGSTYYFTILKDKEKHHDKKIYHFTTDLASYQAGDNDYYNYYNDQGFIDIIYDTEKEKWYTDNKSVQHQGY